MRPSGTGDCTVGVDDRPSSIPHAADRARAGRGSSPPVTLSPVEAVAPAPSSGRWRCSRRSTASPPSGSTRRWRPPTRPSAAVARRRPLGVLHGVPVAVKDTTPVAGHRTTLGLPRLRALGARPRRLHRHGAAAGRGRSSSGRRRHPSSPTRCAPTARSGASPATPTTPTAHRAGRRAAAAAAVASGCVPLAEGSDMGGSVRIPAAWCGVVGLKPGLGRIPMDVLPGLFDSISHHGPLARCADDARLFLAATQGPDDADIMSIPGPLDLARPLDPDLDRHAPRAVRRPRLLGGRPRDRRRRDRCGRATRGRRRDGRGGRPGVHAEPTRRPGASCGRVFMATYYGHLLDEFGERMDPEVVAPDRGRAAPVGASTTSASSSSAPSSGGACAPILADHDALLCPTMAAAAVAGRQGRRRRGPPRTSRRLPLPRHDRRVQPRLAVPRDVGAVRPAHAAPTTPACRSGCRSSDGAGARTPCCESAGRSR